MRSTDYPFRWASFPDLAHEVGGAGRVHQRHAVAGGLERGHGQRKGELALLLLGLEVEARRPVVHAPHPGDGPGGVKEMLAERRLSGTRVAGQDDVAEVREIDALHRGADLS